MNIKLSQISVGVLLHIADVGFKQQTKNDPNCT